jgi:ribosomal protein S18 acetylase RimI-like enzyme
MLTYNWNFRKAVLQDVDYFLEAYFQIYGAPLDRHSFVELYKKKLKSQSSYLYVAENELGSTIGCIVCELQESFQILKPVLQIKEFYISQKYRKLHLADELYAYVERTVINKGIAKIEVLCNLTSTTTQNFYIRKKFIGDKKSYIKNI